MTLRTKTQMMARGAYSQISTRKLSKEYVSFAREFPALVHSCGLAQAVAFARAKKQHHLDYVNDLTAVLRAIGHDAVDGGDGLGAKMRDEKFTVGNYMRLSRDALMVANWLKRYAEAPGEK